MAKISDHFFVHVDRESPDFARFCRMGRRRSHQDRGGQADRQQAMVS
jgi:hypothetical protein